MVIGWDGWDGWDVPMQLMGGRRLGPNLSGRARCARALRQSHRGWEMARFGDFLVEVESQKVHDNVPSMCTPGVL